MNKFYAPIIFVLAILILSGCASSSSQTLVDQSWLLTDLNGETPVPGTTITMEFGEEDRVAGSSGCNSYSTTYAVDGSNLTFGEQMASTLMACLEPVMEQERVYLQALADTTTFEVVDDVLVLFDTDGNELASYVVIDQSLSGSSWTLIGYNNGKGGVVSVIIGTEITANFSEDDRLAGNSGCNNYSAQYETDGDQIKIETAEVTEMACLEPEGVMEQEQLYLAALKTADTYKIDGITMEMRTSEGAMVANFQRAP